MKRLTIITALLLGSITSFAQGTLKCENASFEFGVLTAVDKIPAGEQNSFIRTLIMKKRITTLPFMNFA